MLTLPDFLIQSVGNRVIKALYLRACGESSYKQHDESEMNYHCTSNPQTLS